MHRRAGRADEIDNRVKKILTVPMVCIKEDLCGLGSVFWDFHDIFVATAGAASSQRAFEAHAGLPRLDLVVRVCPARSGESWMVDGDLFVRKRWDNLQDHEPKEMPCKPVGFCFLAFSGRRIEKLRREGTGSWCW